MSSHRPVHPYKKNMLLKAMGERTLTQFAIDAGISAGNLSRIMRGQKVTFEILAKLANAAHNNITYERLSKLFGYIPDGELTEVQFAEYLNRLEIALSEKGLNFNEIKAEVNKQPGYTYTGNMDDLDARAGFSSEERRDWYKSKSKVTYEDVYCISDYYGISVDYLLGRTDDRKATTPPDDGLEDNAKYKRYSEIYEAVSNKLVEIGINRPGEDITPDQLKLFLQFGEAAAIEIIKSKGRDTALLYK